MYPPALFPLQPLLDLRGRVCESRQRDVLHVADELSQAEARRERLQCACREKWEAIEVPPAIRGAGSCTVRDLQLHDMKRRGLRAEHAALRVELDRAEEARVELQRCFSRLRDRLARARSEREVVMRQLRHWEQERRCARRRRDEQQIEDLYANQLPG